jgi:hypothetical protein
MPRLSIEFTFSSFKWEIVQDLLPCEQAFRIWSTLSF